MTDSCKDDVTLAGHERRAVDLAFFGKIEFQQLHDVRPHVDETLAKAR